MASSLERAFIDKIRTFASEHDLLQPAGKYLVALSGGADSVALLLALKLMGLDLEACTCNFQLRGSESDRDEQFCVALCQREAVPLHRIHFDTKTYAELHKVSIEMAARELRYRYFHQLRQDLEAQAVCVAHHRDDCVETVLLNLVRGTGINGLRGIRPKHGYVQRPLLCVSRSEIEDFLRTLKQDFVTDSSNLVADVQRNQVRLKLLPMLEQINPAARRNIFLASQHLAEAALMVDASMAEAEKAVFSVQESGDESSNKSGGAKTDDGVKTDGGVKTGNMNVGGVIDIARLLEQVSPQSVLHHILERYAFSSAQCRQIFSMLHAESGRLWSSATHELLLDRGRLLVQPKTALRTSAMLIPEPGRYVYDERRSFSFSVQPITDDFAVSRSAFCVSVDAAQAHFPLTIRPVAEGDRFVPFGMKGSRLVSDVLTDRKLSLFEKRRQLVVADAAGRIVWLVGQRLDNRARISSRSTVALTIALLA